MIVGVSGISGAGKTTLVKRLEKTLHATALFWDEYDEISESPADYVEWHKTRRNYDDWKYDALANVLKKLKAGEKVVCPATGRQLVPTDPILFDAPLGYCHQATGQYIDFLVHIDIPLDIALARRILRDQPKQVAEELEYYLTHSRPLFMMPSKRDLTIDGSLPLDEQENLIIKTLALLHFSNKLDSTNH